MSTREDREADAREDRVHEDQQRDDVCPNCGGDGEIQATTPSWAGEPWWRKCGDCNGTGHIDPDAYEGDYEDGRR